MREKRTHIKCQLVSLHDSPVAKAGKLDVLLLAERLVPAVLALNRVPVWPALVSIVLATRSGII